MIYGFFVAIVVRLFRGNMMLTAEKAKQIAKKAKAAKVDKVQFSIAETAIRDAAERGKRHVQLDIDPDSTGLIMMLEDAGYDVKIKDKHARVRW